MVNDSELIDGVYAVSIEPERYDQLVSVWVERIASELDSKQPFATEQLDVHLQRAMEMIVLLRDSRAAAPPSVPASRGADQPCLSFDNRGRLVRRNSAAVSAYSAVLGSGVDSLPFDASTHLSLQQILEKGFNEPLAASTLRPELIRAVRSDNGRTVLMNLTYEPGKPATIDVRTTDIVWPERLTAVLQHSFGLTSAEADIGRLLVAGSSIAEIAATRSRSVDTVRTQLRTLYSKTSTTSQTEFVRMALGLAALYPSADHPEQDTESARVHNLLPVFPRPEQRHLLTLPDGRVMDYAIFGAKQGNGCLYVHDAQFGHAWSARMGAEAARRGMTIIAPLRAYWGRTDPYPEGANVHEQFAEDVAYLLDTLELKNLVTLSRTIGSAFAYFIVRRSPERFIGMVGAAPGLPIHGNDDMKRMMPHQVLLTGSIRHNPLILKFVVRAIEAVYKRYGLKRLLSMVYRNYPQDLATLEDPVALATMEFGSHLAAEQGISAFYHDFKTSPRGAWSGSFDLPVPLHALIGDGDPNGRLERANKLIAAGKNVRVTLVPGAGDLLLYSSPTAVLDALDEMFEGQRSDQRHTVA